MRGVPMRAIQELLGHASMEMTMRYAHLSPDLKQAMVHRLDEPIPSTLRSTEESRERPHATDTQHADTLRLNGDD
jgi:hypothetical protein